MKQYIIAGFFACASLITAANAQSTNCKEFTSPDGQIQVMCLNGNGSWTPMKTITAKASPSTSTSEALPASFRGQIQYRGNYTGQMRLKAEQGGLRMNNRGQLNLNLGKKKQPFGGSYTLLINFDGEKISGTFTSQENVNRRIVRNGRQTFIGTRKGTSCHMNWSDGSRTVNYCGRSRHSVEFKNQIDPQGNKYDQAFQGNAMRLTDYAERDHKRALAASRRPRQVQAQATNAAAPAAAIYDAKFATDSQGNPILTEKAMETDLATILELMVRTDAKSWRANRYTVGSMRNVRYLRADTSKNTYVAAGDFQFQGLFGGGVNSVELEVTNGQFKCISFADDSRKCRPLGQSISMTALSEFAKGMANGAASDTGAAARDAARRQRDMNAMKALQGQ